MSETHAIVTEVTYAELVALIDAEALEPGLMYQLTDYKTVYYMAGGNSLMGFSHLTEDGSPIIQEGETEQLLLTATSSNTLDKRVKSLSYPDDIIHYDWNPDNWLNNLNFSTDGVNIVNGFKGVIHFRRDTILNNQTNHDYRNVVNRMFNITQPTWELGAYNEGDYVTHEGVIYYANAAITDEEPGVDPEWVFVININDNAYLSFDPAMFIVGNSVSEFLIIPVLDDTDYEDMEWLGEYCANCEIPEYVLQEVGMEAENVLLPLISFGNGCVGISFGNDCSLISFGDSCEAVSFGSGCDGISFGNECEGISFGNDCSLISFGDSEGISFGNNCFGISFGNECEGISFGNNCSVISFGNNCSGISFGNECSEISFGNNCSESSFGNNCSGISFGDSAWRIDLKDGVYDINAITLGLTLSGNGTKIFQCNADGDVLMLAYDGTDTLQITNLADI